MTFKQNHLFLRQMVIFDLLMGVAVLLPLLRGATEDEWKAVWMVGVCLAAVTLATWHTWWDDPDITMEAKGVRCVRRGEVLWAFAWSEIEQVRKTTRHRSTAVQLIPVTEPVRDLHTPQETPFYGFQLSRKAKIALEKYCPGYRK